MNYQEKSKSELIEELQSRDRFILNYEQMQEQELDLTFAWTGNLGHWHWDIKKNLVKFNKKKATALGYSEDEIPENVGFEWFTEKLHPDDYDMVMQNMVDHLHHNSDIYEVEYRIQAKNGDWKWYHDRGKITQRDEHGNPTFLSGIVFDITEKKAIEEKQSKLIEMLSEQMKIQENIYSVIFHDLANPLNSIIGFARILKETIENDNCDDDTKRFIDIMYKSSTNAINITKTLINWTKAKRDFIIDKESFDLSEFLAEIFEEFEVSLNSKNLKYNVNIPNNPQVTTNKPILKIALRNFMSNAIKYSNNSGSISIAFDKNNLTISDNGVGMEPDQLQKLFQSNLSPSVGTAYEKGHGLGLIIVKDLLDQSNIKVDIQSEVNKGTTVTLFL